ncbi:MAG TPA: hypothetical protein VII08_04300 [Myxococcales bacterium]
MILEIAEEVATALRERRPVVALETGCDSVSARGAGWGDGQPQHRR